MQTTSKVFKTNTTGDIVTSVPDSSSFYQIDVSTSSGAVTGTLSVIYSVPGIDDLKILKDAGGNAITINLASPNVISIDGLHFDQIGVRPTVAVAGGTYDVAFLTESQGESSRG